MKKYKSGFTLAETLITLGIIGVVAAVTLPALISDVNTQANSRAVARAKELLEQSMLNIILTANQNSNDGVGVGINSLTDIQMKDLVGGNDASYIIVNNERADSNLITKTLALTGIKGFAVNNYTIREYTGNGTYNVENFPIYKFDKSDAIIIYRPIPRTDSLNNIQNDNVLTRIVIDVNGDKEPNRLGRDVFVFGLANNGHIVPAGSAAYNNNIMGETLDVYPTTCTDNNIGNGLTCAARVAAEGWKINY